MNKILLINPHNVNLSSPNSNAIPTNLLYLASSLQRDGHIVKINDLCINNVINYDFNPDIVGITCFFSAMIEEVNKLSKLIKQKLNCPIILGGIHPTIFTHDILITNNNVDYVCIGEGEHTISQLANNIPLNQINNLAYRGQGNICFNDKFFMNNLDNLPFPNYNLLNLDQYKINITKFKNKNRTKYTPIPIISSRSCPNQCNFCSMFLVHGKKWRARSANNVVDEIEYVYRTYHRTGFSFMMEK